MILDTSLISLKAVLAGAITTSQPQVHIDYDVYGTDGQKGKPGTFRVALNSTSDVTILAAPGTQGMVFDPQLISVFNKDTASVTVIVKTDDGTTQRIIIEKTLATLESLHWSSQSGWYISHVASANGTIGTATNDSAPAGYVGEFAQTLVASGAAVSLTTTTAANVCSVSLTAGDWDVEGNINFIGASATITAGQGGISATSATLPADGSEVYDGTVTTVLSDTSGIALPRKRQSLATTTTIYLVAKKTFSAGTVTAFGQINARRVR